MRGQGSGGQQQSPSPWHQGTALFVADTPLAWFSPLPLLWGSLAGGCRQDLGLTAAQAWCQGDGQGAGCLWHSWPGLLAQQGGQDKAAAILRGWGRDKSGTGSPGGLPAAATPTPTPPPPSFMYPLVIPQNHLWGWEPLGRTPVPSPLCQHPRASSGTTPWGWGLGAQDRAQGLALPPLYALPCAPKPQRHAPSLCSLPIPKAGTAEISNVGRAKPIEW